MRDAAEMAQVRRRLGRLRLGLRLWQCGAGASRLIGVATLLVFLSLAADRTLRMDLIQRVISLLLGSTALLVLAWRWLIRPLSRRVSAEALLVRVERRQPELGGRLLAGWEFAGMGDLPEGASPALVAATIGEGQSAAERADFEGVLDWERFRRRCRIGVAALAVLAAAVVVAPQTLGLWFSRNILLSVAEWPRQTRLRVQGVVDGVLRVPVAGDLALVVRAEGVQPGEVMFRYEDKTGASYSEQMPRVGEVYRTVFRAVSEPFRVQVSGGDDRTEWIAVELLPRPEITAVTVTVEPPAYTGRKRSVLDARAGVYAVAAGSSVVLEGRASQGLREVEVGIAGNRLQALTLENAAAFTIRLPPDQVKTATYRLQAVAANGIPTLRPTTVSLRVDPDRQPRVTASLDGIGQLVLPRASIPVVGDLQDDYGIADAWLEYQYQSPAGQNSGLIKVPLSLRDAVSTGGVMRVSHTLELLPMKLETDATMSLRVAARDGNTVSGPGQGQSASFTLRVVTEEELRRDFTRREQIFRQRLERLIQEQRVLADESRLLHSGPDASAKRDEGRLLAIEKRQKQNLPGLTAITTGVGQIRAEAYYNRLEADPSPLLKRLDGAVIAPLRDVAAGLLPGAADRVAAARQSTDPAECRTAWREAEIAQRRVIAALMDIRKNLQASDDASELIRLMEEILTNQKTVNRETSRKAASAIENIFEKK